MLLLIAGPIAQWGGWAAAFTSAGALLLLAGTATSLAGFFVHPRRWTLAPASASALVGGWRWFLTRWLLG